MWKLFYRLVGHICIKQIFSSLTHTNSSALKQLPCGFGPGFFLSSLRALSQGASHTCPVFSTDGGFSSVEVRGVVLFFATEFFLSSSFVGDTESLRWMSYV